MSTPPTHDEISDLLSRSMLEQSRLAAEKYVGQGRFWQKPYAEANPRGALSIASVWFTAYPPSIITREGESVLKTLGDRKLWSSLSSIGVRGIHTGPMKRAGGWRDNQYTPSVDGNFDRIGFEIDPIFGSVEEFVSISRVAAAYNAIVIDDVVPAHTGKGPDFRLAEMHHSVFPGLYHMVQIAPEDWSLLPDVAIEKDSMNLDANTVDVLAAKGYIIGHLQRVIFFEPGVKETDWSVTPPVVGVDGIERRWVYLHYFKEGQPSLNWLDPSFAAQQMIIGDALHSIDTLGARGLRLDANGFLGAERRSVGTAWSEGHPLSVVGNQLLAGMIRKAGAFSFQELNLAVDDIAAMSKGGADLSYDFITRPAYQHALLTGDTEFLRLMLKTVHQFGIDPASLIHALQNHDELTTELVHFWTLHANDIYAYQGTTWQGRTLRTHIRETIYERLSGPHARYNLRFVTNGVSCTTASIIAAAIGIEDLDSIEVEQAELIKKVHLLLAMFNALQPGVFALSGWDLVGALPLKAEQVEHLMQDGDTRWIGRGAYDLTGESGDQIESHLGLPKARSLYGSITEQLESPASFASQLKKLLAVREAYGIANSRQVSIPDVVAPGLLVMVHELPDERGTQITALNFGREPIEEVITLENVRSGPVIDMINETDEGDLQDNGELKIHLEPYEGLSLRVIGALPTL